MASGIQKLCSNCRWYALPGEDGCHFGFGNLGGNGRCRDTRRFTERERPPHRDAPSGWPTQRYIIHGPPPKDQVSFKRKDGKAVSFKKGGKKK